MRELTSVGCALHFCYSLDRPPACPPVSPYGLENCSCHDDRNCDTWPCRYRIKFRQYRLEQVGIIGWVLLLPVSNFLTVPDTHDILVYIMQF